MNKQKILNIIIILATVALIGIIGWIVYEQKIANKKEVMQNQNTVNVTQNNEVEIEEERKLPVEEEKEEEEQYIGEEETSTIKEENTGKSKEEKAIELAKKEWGNDDTVTFNIEEKKGDIYYVAVKSDANVISWYEVNTTTWEISEF